MTITEKKQALPDSGDDSDSDNNRGGCGLQFLDFFSSFLKI